MVYGSNWHVYKSACLDYECVCTCTCTVHVLTCTFSVCLGIHVVSAVHVVYRLLLKLSAIMWVILLELISYSYSSYVLHMFHYFHFY